ncbi:MAG: tRNA (adenosine(37)-N6)-dimethylallyltransferase MiaA [bacterium]|nr:tRNA (adenosine(37)-N6)-dimethylallyltransferase MiaA [bacterium]
MNREIIYNLIVILGPTASGKTALAARLASELGSEIISADSRQVFRGMDIGTGKDLSEFCIDDKHIPYHLIDIIDPTDEFSVYDFQRLFYGLFEDCISREIAPVLVGGTGLYIDSVLRGYSMQKVPVNKGLRADLDGVALNTVADRLKTLRPGLHNTTDLFEKERAIRALEIALFERDNPTPKGNRPEIVPLVFGTRWDRPLLRDRISKRLKDRLDAGMVEEVARLHEEGISWEKLNYFGLEYRYIGLFLQGKLNRNDMFQKLNSAIHQFAKRQETWFRRMERHGIDINWIDDADYDRLKKIVNSKLTRSIKNIKNAPLP